MPTGCASSSPRPSRHVWPRTPPTGTRSCILTSRTARIEHDKALLRVMTAVMKDDTELFKQFMDNEGFKRWLTDTVFGLTYGASGL
jgi:hypothetical protein